MCGKKGQPLVCLAGCEDSAAARPPAGVACETLRRSRSSLLVACTHWVPQGAFAETVAPLAASACVDPRPAFAAQGASRTLRPAWSACAAAPACGLSQREMRLKGGLPEKSKRKEVGEAGDRAMSGRAIFLDKDGTLIDKVPHNVDPEHLRLNAGAAAALRLLRDAGFRLVVVSNQSGIARGYFSEKELLGVERVLRDLLAYERLELSGFYYCPHHPNGSRPLYAVSCVCRKPRPGLLTRAAAELDLDLARSWMVADVLDDVEAGLRAGCRTVLIDDGNETEWRNSEARLPHHEASDLDEAARLILQEEAERERETALDERILRPAGVTRAAIRRR